MVYPTPFIRHLIRTRDSSVTEASLIHAVNRKNNAKCVCVCGEEGERIILQDQLCGWICWSGAGPSV